MIEDRHPLSARGLRVSRGSNRIIRNLDLNVRPGSFVSLVGASGCGKTTLLQALAGFIPRAGEARLAGNPGFVFQKDGVFPFMTVEENLSFAIDGLPDREKAGKLASLLGSAGLESCAKRYPAELSGGQVQRLNCARAFAGDASVILCDEPFSALDELTRNSMQAWLLELWAKERRTVLFVTHSIEEAIFLADEVMVLRDGGISGTFPVTFPRPRAEQLRFTPEFCFLRKAILSQI